MKSQYMYLVVKRYKADLFGVVLMVSCLGVVTAKQKTVLLV